MKIEDHNAKPLFLQIRDGLETAILSGTYGPEMQIPSTTELSLAYKINPATALKGVNALVDEGILYKQRGIGIFVCADAPARLRKKRRLSFREDYIRPLKEEALRLGISTEELIHWINQEGSENANH
uniref:GntR family transcriptional regulator n=1 Tax=Ndongobacter massiliensis TaxID=1871025 RepID=UPI0009308133|nr:GntR family transcriptional regulator [Ndongobacter massiliensis]